MPEALVCQYKNSEFDHRNSTPSGNLPMKFSKVEKASLSKETYLLKLYDSYMNVCKLLLFAVSFNWVEDFLVFAEER